MSTTLSYGGNELIPVPFMTIEKTFQKNRAGIAVGTLLIVTLRGTLIDLDGNLPGILNEQIRYLRSTFDKDGKYFEITCNGVTLFEGYPRIIQALSFEQSNDNWVFTCPYSVVLEFDNEPHDVNTNYVPVSGENIGTSATLMPPFIADESDTWNFEFDQQIAKYDLNISGNNYSGPLLVRATHEVNAVGKSHYDGPQLTGTLTKQAWEWAKDYVSTKLNQNPFIPMASGLLNISTGGWGVFDHFRVQKVSETEGSFGISETFLLTSSNSGVIEDFNVEIRRNLTDVFTSVNIQGTIQGLESRNYGIAPTGFSINTTKFTNATGYFNIIKDNLVIFPRVQSIISNEGIILNSEPLTRIVGESPTKGTVTYQYEFNNRPSNCIAGARQETISISDDNPSDIFSKIQVMGRAQGPILQSFNTITEFRRTVSIDALVSPPTGCTISILTGTNNPNSSATSILCSFENDLRTRYNRVYKERDNTNWSPKDGRYSRSVTWVAVDCTTAPPISLCSGA